MKKIILLVLVMLVVGAVDALGCKPVKTITGQLMKYNQYVDYVRQPDSFPFESVKEAQQVTLYEYNSTKPLQSLITSGRFTFTGKFSTCKAYIIQVDSDARYIPLIFYPTERVFLTRYD